jgi:ORF6N domain.
MRKILKVVPLARIERAILFIRGEKVMLDTDLARLYGVATGAFNRAVKRNLSRFPDDFMFQLTAAEAKSLRCQIGTSNVGRGGRRYRPFVFTEQGVAMLSSVLHSERAVAVNIQIMRAFVRLRQLLASNAELARKLEGLEKKYDRQFKVVFDAIRQLMSPPAGKHREIGFHVKAEDSAKTKARRNSDGDHLRRTSGAWRSWR